MSNIIPSAQASEARAGKERPILFSAPMVRALLDGSKTQTRRIVKLPPAPASLGEWQASTIGGQNGGFTAAGLEVPLQAVIWHTRTGKTLSSPYGQPGDRLWVRETFQGPLFDGDQAEAYRAAPESFNRPDFCKYAADGGGPPEFMTMDDEFVRRWRPSIHMPRWASRILLEIVSVRVERLNDCSEADARAEGVRAIPCDHIRFSCEEIGCCGPTAKGMYAALWDIINNAGSWAANPWVWVVEFKQTNCAIERGLKD